MNVIWKRPDGFHDVLPSDFRVIELTDGSRLWTHKENVEWFPFRVSGGWKDEDSTMKLNRLINLLDQSDEQWSEHLKLEYENSDSPTEEEYIKNLLIWLAQMQNLIKGDSWELHLMKQVFIDISSKIVQIQTSESE